MSANITLITLGVVDVTKATGFYESLGFVKSKTASQDDVTFFHAAASCSRCGAARRSARMPMPATLWNGNGGIVVAQNVASEAEVDAVMAKAAVSGARILKPPSTTFWGGYNGYCAVP